MTRTYDLELPYEVLYSFVLFDPNEIVASTILYSLMTLFIRVHGSIGLHNALMFRMKCYSKNFRKFLTIYLEVPTLELFGFWAGLKEQSLALFFNLQAGNDNFLMAVPMEAFPSLEMVEALTLKYYPAFFLAIIAFGLFNVLKLVFWTDTNSLS